MNDTYDIPEAAKTYWAKQRDIIEREGHRLLAEERKKIGVDYTVIGIYSVGFSLLLERLDAIMTPVVKAPGQTPRRRVAPLENQPENDNP